jgi:LysM repeat protein
MGRKITPPGYHQVDQGDWLSKIAWWYRTRVQELRPLLLPPIPRAQPVQA